MAREEDRSSEDAVEQTEGEVIDFGQIEPVRSGGDDGTDRAAGHAHTPGSHHPRWTTWLALGIAAAVAVAIGVRLGTSNHAKATALPSPTAAPTPPTPPAGVTDEPQQPAYFEVPNPILGIVDAWELFGYGDNEVVRIQFGDGGVTRTPIPPLASTGPVSFVAGPGWAVVRPLDVVPGYIVRERNPAASLPSSLNVRGPAFVGPGRNDVWVPSNDSGPDTHMVLTGVDGRREGPQISIPSDMAVTAQSDGAGYIVTVGVGGAYDARPDGLHRITSGELLATGPTRWLTLECDPAYVCHKKVIDRATGLSRQIGPPMPATQTHGGTIVGTVSPDGHFAAILERTFGYSLSIHLVDLDSGRDTRITTPVDYDATNMVFSPDSRWLFVAGGGGILYAVNPATGVGQALDVVLPPLRQLSIRDVGN